MVSCGLSPHMTFLPNQDVHIDGLCQRWKREVPVFTKTQRREFSLCGGRVDLKSQNSDRKGQYNSAREFCNIVSQDAWQCFILINLFGSIDKGMCSYNLNLKITAKNILKISKLPVTLWPKEWKIVFWELMIKGSYSNDDEFFFSLHSLFLLCSFTHIVQSWIPRVDKKIFQTTMRNKSLLLLLLLKDFKITEETCFHARQNTRQKCVQFSVSNPVFQLHNSHQQSVY